MTTTQKWNGFGMVLRDEDQGENARLMTQAPRLVESAMAKGLMSVRPPQVEAQRAKFKVQSGTHRVDAMLMGIVCAVFSVSEDQVRSESRLAHITEARQVLVYCLHELCGWGWTRIGRFIGRHHGPVIHAHRQISDRVELEAALKGRVQRVIEEFSRGTKTKGGSRSADLHSAGCRHLIQV